MQAGRKFNDLTDEEHERYWETGELPVDVQKPAVSLALKKAGRELDALVAEKVMGEQLMFAQHIAFGVKIVEYNGQDPETDDGEIVLKRLIDGRHTVLEASVPHRSTDIAAAWQVVEAFFNHKVEVYPTKEITVEYGWLEHPIAAWHCQIGWHHATADTPSLAICLAALKAIGITIE